MNRRILSSLLLSLLFLLAVNTQASTFTAGNVVVYTVYSASALTSASTAVELSEYHYTAGSPGTWTLVQTVPLNNTGSTAGTRLTASGTASSEGILSLSDDGQYVLLTGYDANTGVAAIASSASATYNRMVAKVKYDGTVSLQPFNNFTGNNPRAATLDCGGGMWMAGASSPGLGYYSGSFSSTSRTLTSLTSLSATNMRQVTIQNGQLYYTSSSSTTGLFSVGTALGATGGATTYSQIGTSTQLASPYSFVMLNLGTQSSPQLVMYVADNTNGVVKYSYSSGAWAYNNSYAVTNLYHITGSVVAGKAVLYYTTATAGNVGGIVQLTDANGFNTNSSFTAGTALVSPSNTCFRGIVMSPVAVASPATQASNVTFPTVGSNSMTINWTAGSGAGSLVYISTTNSFTAPTNGSAPGTVTTVGNGTTTQPQTLVYSGTGGSVSLTGLAAGTTYYVQVYADNYATDVTVHPACSYLYNTTSPATGNTTTTPSPNLLANGLSSTTVSVPNTTANVASAPASFTLTGSYLTGTSITLTPPAGYQLSFSSGSGYTTGGLVISNGSNGYSSPNLSTTLYVEALNPTVGANNANITFTANGGGVTTPPIVSLAGNIIADAPSTQATYVTFTADQSNQFTVGWTNGNGSNRIVTIRPTATSSAIAPTNATDYSVGVTQNLSTTPVITGTKNYVVYNSATSGAPTPPITITGLSPNTNYTVEVYEYNGAAATSDYNTSTNATPDPGNETTTVPSYYWNGSTTSGTGTLVGGAGAWNTSSTNWLTGNSGGASYIAWPTGAAGSGYNANFSTGAGIVGCNTTVYANSEIFSLTGFTLTATGSSQNNYANISLSGSNINLNLNSGSTNTFYQFGDITSSLGVSGSNGITIGAPASGFTEIAMLTNNSTIAVPVTLNLGSGVSTILTGIVGKATGVTMTGKVTLVGTVGQARAMLCATTPNSMAISGNITGTGDIQFSSGGSGGAGTLSLSNTANNFTGNLYMVGATNGVFQASAGVGTCVPSSMSVFYPTSSQGGIFDIFGSDVTIAGLSQTAAGAQGAITNRGTSAATLIINQTTTTSFGSIGNLTTGDSISDGTSALALTKSGIGTLTLAGKNTYTGATTVTGGSLFIDNASGSGLASGSAVTVSSAGAIGGSGTVAGTIALTGTVSPGASASPAIGSFTTGAQTWNDGANYKFDISNVAGTAGTNWDLLTSTGAVDVSTGNYTIDLTGNPTGFSNTASYVWTFLTASGITGFSSSRFTVLTTNFTAAFTGVFTVIQTGSMLQIKYCPRATASNTGIYIPGQTISLSSGPSGQTSYAWSGPQSFTASTENATRPGATSLMSGTYVVTVTSPNGCSDTAHTFVSVNALGDYVWTGATSNVWTTVTNWSPTSPVGGPSGCTQNVIIPNTVNDPVISTSTSIGNITINDNAQLTLNGSLSVCGFLAGGVTTPPVITGSSHLILTGTAAQTVSGMINANYLEVNNTSSSGVMFPSGNITINKALIMTQGNFTNNGGSVTLASNASGDAYLDNFTSGTAGTYNYNLTVQRYISNTADGYRDLGSAVVTNEDGLNSAYPITGQNQVECWYAYSPYPNLQVYDETLIIPSANGSVFGHWRSYTSLSALLYPMKGYAFRTYLGSTYTINFTGQPNNGTYTAPITHTTSVVPANDGWNFLSNPYPSPIKWSLVKAMNAAVANGEYYVYNTTGEFTGNWGTFNGTTGVNGAVDEIATSQGFFVQAPASTTFTMNNTVRTTNTSGLYFGASPVLDNEVRLVLAGGTNSDEIVTYTDPQATDGYDPDLDAVKMPAGSTVGISYVMPGHDYAINVMNTINEHTELPLSITVSDTGSYTLNATILNVPGLTAYLRDAQSRQNISLTNLANGPITLALNGGQTYNGRFSVVFRPTPVVTTGITNTEQAATRIYSYGNKVYIERPNSESASITVTNLLGQDVKELISDTQQTEFEMPAVQPWYAIVKVTQGGNVTVAKVLISNQQ